MKQYFHSSWQLSKEIFQNFFADRVFKLSAALAYYTVFALPSLLLMIIAITGYFFGQEAMEGKIFGQINHIVGDKAAAQIQSAIKSIHLSGDTKSATIVGLVTLLLSASGIFGEIQDSINLIWGLRVKAKRGFVKIFINRLISFSLILSIGFVMIVSLAINGLLSMASEIIYRLLPFVNVNLLLIFDNIFQFGVITLLFAVIFKVLPDARIHWKDVGAGALATAILFYLGKLVIGYYLSRNSTIDAYGAAGSIILILLWVYYSSIILYTGAQFTQAYASHFGNRIMPNRYAEWVEKEMLQAKPSQKQ